MRIIICKGESGSLFRIFIIRNDGILKTTRFTHDRNRAITKVHQQDIGKGKQRVGKADNAQVLHALCDDALLIGEKRETEMREEKDRRP